MNCVCLLAIICVTITLVWCFQTSGKSLVYHASSTLVKFEDHQMEGGLLWRSDKEVLVLTNKAGEDWKASQCDLSTGGYQPVEAINKTFGKFQMHDPFTWSVSPNGQWVLWTAGTDERPLWIAAKLNAQKRIDWPRNREQSIRCVWMPDSSGWATLATNQNSSDLIVHDLSGHSTILELPSWCKLLGFTSQSSLLTTDFETPANTQSIHIEEYNIHSKPKVIRTFDVPIPSDVETIDNLALSPKGDQLLWALTLSKTNTLSEWIRHLLNPFGYHPHSTFSLRVSNLDGSNMKTIGNQSIDMDKPVPNWWPNNTAWMPDGKRASFIYQDTLFVVPIR